MSAQNLIDKFSASQTLPHVITRLSSLMADSDSTMKDFEDVIKMDPILVARLLKLVNSPYFGLLHRVDSIARAIAYLGMKNLHAIAVTQALKTIFTDKKETTIFSRKQLWLHCAAVSICAKMVAERIFGINGDDAYLAGILHDFGIIVEDQTAPEKFIDICRDCTSTTMMLDKERESFGTDHCEIGYLMTNSWSMSPSITEAIRDHHSVAEDMAPHSLAGILQIAEYLVARHGYTTLPATRTEISPALIEHLQENGDEYGMLLEDFPEEMENARDLYSDEEAK